MEIGSRPMETAQIEFTDSRFTTHSFSEKVGSTGVLFKVLKMKDSLFVWIGSSQEPKLVNMCVAMKNPYESLPLTTQVLGSRTDEMSPGLASQLTRRLNKPVFVGVNVELDRFLFPEVTKRLNEEIKKHPECF
ncbi:proteasome assembly chaperone 4-like [Homalodisca vitripennis]|nr:proteasome assembly chaperone 4-like [Homalodisca vitripennis]KAG8283705.1 proteasome (prosome, macropain) assembly chaperone 4 [Homalodisca vitripennis]